ncbi:MAG TPA: nucleotidyltransferase domain-containing protein [Acidobacteriota bacterium]
MNRNAQLDQICIRFGLLAVYLFGSRAEDGLRVLQDQAVPPEGSDLDVALVFDREDFDPLVLSDLQVAFEDFFEPLRVDLVPIQRVDPVFAFAAIDGHRIAATDPNRADYYELAVMSQASELLPRVRRLELDLFGVTTP